MVVKDSIIKPVALGTLKNKSMYSTQKEIIERNILNLIFDIENCQKKMNKAGEVYRNEVIKYSNQQQKLREQIQHFQKQLDIVNLKKAGTQI